jgi:sarcosine oxidase subunit alpha
MTERRIRKHPILSIPRRKRITFYWNNRKLQAYQGEMIATALFANGIHVFGHHVKDGSAQGMFCANGQCAQCAVVANGIPVKSCMTKVAEHMVVESLEDLPELPKTIGSVRFSQTEQVTTDVLIVGGGPAGLSAAIELGERDIPTLIVDDKDRLGGKLVLQTHKFFGSIEDCYAGTRGTDIARILEERIEKYPHTSVWLNSTALYVFSDKKVGIVTDAIRYRIVDPKIVLNAAGAREKSLIFPGNTLPGVYGAGAFQTLVNRDLVRPAKRLFVIGGGNVGIIAAYHALQAGIDVAGLAEALPECSGYKVHADKIKRLGVPIYTGHTVLSATGEEHVESVTIGEVDHAFRAIPGTEKTYECDTVLVAVGLSPIHEFYQQADQAGIRVFAAGDAKEIAEASSAMFNGKIAGFEIARELGAEDKSIPEEWQHTEALLKSPAGLVEQPCYDSFPDEGITPVFHCAQEIPCNPCVSVCPKGVITIPGDSLLGKPEVTGNQCIGCNKCVLICPGLAIALVDYRDDPNQPVVSLAYEVHNYKYKEGDTVVLTDLEGKPLHEAVIIETVMSKASRKTQIIKVKVPKEIAKQVAGFKIQSDEVALPTTTAIKDRIPDDAIICRCERVTAAEIRQWIRRGMRDVNQIKAVTRAGMGACGSKTCGDLIAQLFTEEGVSLKEVTPHTVRPLYVEEPLGLFASASHGKKR